MFKVRQTGYRLICMEIQRGITDQCNYINLCSNLWAVDISTLLKTIKSFTGFVINRMLTDGMPIEGVNWEVAICSVHSSDSEGTQR